MSCLDVIKQMRIEPFLFLFMFAWTLENLSITQLAQDKICLFRYGLEVDYCAQLSDQVSSDTEFDFKNRILSDVTTFMLYKTLIDTIPIIFWSLFLGAWADRHPKAPKFLMTVVTIGSAFKSILLIWNTIYFENDENLILLSFIPFSISGGLLSVMMSLYSYISATTEPNYRTIKFAIIEAIIFIAAPIGIFIGGLLIGPRINGSSGQLHNYLIVFMLGLCAQVLATIWIICIPLKNRIVSNKSNINSRLDKNGNICQKTKPENSDNSKIKIAEELEPLLKTPIFGSPRADEIKYVEEVLNISLSQQQLSESIDTNNSTELYSSTVLEQSMTITTIAVLSQQESSHWFAIFRDLFLIQNIKDMFESCTKARTGTIRMEIWMLIISQTLVALTNHGANIVLFQFVQKVFQWNAEIYSDVNAVALLITSLSVVIIVPLLIKKCKITDTSLSIVGISSVFLQNLIRGTILDYRAFFLSYVIGSLSHVPAISVRSKLSNLVDRSEVNKVFSLMATLETITPFIASIIYSTLFSTTIATYPGLVFQMSSAILFIPFVVFIYISLYFE